MKTITKKEDYVAGLLRSRAKLVEMRRALVKRDCSTDRNEGYAERIVSIQAAIEATDRAVSDERRILVDASEPGATERAA